MIGHCSSCESCYYKRHARDHIDMIIRYYGDTPVTFIHCQYRDTYSPILLANKSPLPCVWYTQCTNLSTAMDTILLLSFVSFCETYFCEIIAFLVYS